MSFDLEWHRRNTFWTVPFYTFSKMNEIVLSTAYLPPISYVQKLATCKAAYVEQFDSYHKQTYRNRCRILAANGPMNLSIPVVKQSGLKTLVKDVMIDYSTSWQAIHWRSILSGYNSSPFLEFYIDDLYPFYHQKVKFLVDFNMKVLEFVLEALELDVLIERTTDYFKSYENKEDCRELFSPKRNENLPVSLKAYSQTFSNKFGFVEDLSILDLLLNLGPESNLYL